VTQTYIRNVDKLQYQAKKFMETVLDMNAEHINITCSPAEREAWLSTHAPTYDEFVSKDLVCGYHIYDNAFRIFLLEGTEKAITKVKSFVNGYLFA
jgi:hypothetical protein